MKLPVFSYLTTKLFISLLKNNSDFDQPNSVVWRETLKNSLFVKELLFPTLWLFPVFHLQLNYRRNKISWGIWFYTFFLFVSFVERRIWTRIPFTQQHVPQLSLLVCFALKSFVRDSNKLNSMNRIFHLFDVKY